MSNAVAFARQTVLKALEAAGITLTMDGKGQLLTDAPDPRFLTFVTYMIDFATVATVRYGRALAGLQGIANLPGECQAGHADQALRAIAGANAMKDGAPDARWIELVDWIAAERLESPVAKLIADLGTSDDERLWQLDEQLSALRQAAAHRQPKRVRVEAARLGACVTAWLEALLLKERGAEPPPPAAPPPPATDL